MLVVRRPNLEPGHRSAVQNAERYVHTTINCVLDETAFFDDMLSSAIERGVLNWPLEQVDIHITTDIQSRIRELLPHLQSYRTERGAGRVAGRAVTELPTPVLVLDGLLLEEHGPGFAERLVAHEAGHLVLHERGETTDDLPHLARNHWRAWLGRSAHIAVEEFRIERALFDWGYPPSLGRDAEHTADTLYMLNLELHEVLTDPASADVEEFALGVLALVSDLSKHLAYAAAWVASEHDWIFPVSGFDQLQTQSWLDFVGPHWEARAAFYDSLAAAHTPVSPQQLRKQAEAALKLEIALLRRVGFYFSGGPQSGSEWGFWRVQNEAMWIARSARAHAEAVSRGDLSVDGAPQSG